LPGVAVTFAGALGTSSSKERAMMKVLKNPFSDVTMLVEPVTLEKMNRSISVRSLEPMSFLLSTLDVAAKLEEIESITA
jgi:hypothetical protein